MKVQYQTNPQEPFGQSSIVCSSFSRRLYSSSLSLAGPPRSLTNSSLFSDNSLALVHSVSFNACKPLHLTLISAIVTWLSSIGAAILSHHVDTFALVAAFFLFSLGCLNVFIGLIWRASARDKRSVTSWRESKKDVLPKNFKDIKPMAWSGSPALSHRNMSSPPPSFKSVDDHRPLFHSSAMQRSVDRGHRFQQSLDEKAAVAAAYDSEAGVNRMGYGFGRQGEKAAAMKGL